MVLVQELTKFAVLNYMAVIKAIKKRNKRLKEVCGDAVVPILSFDVLQHQPFFYSRALSQVATSAAILEEVCTSGVRDSLLLYSTKHFVFKAM